MTGRRSAFLAGMLAIGLGSILLTWPAFWNRYPLLFSDTGALMEMSLEPTMGWDKPWIYGPFLHLFHWRTTLWLPLVGQGVMMSATLWWTARVFDVATPRRHVTLCAILAIVTAAPWFTALLMPDVFTPVVVLSLIGVGFGRHLGRWTIAAMAVIGAVAIASHLAHLILAAACVVMIGLVRWQLPWRPACVLAGALGLLIATNIVGYGRVAVSPHGSVFALARLIGDGPGRWYIDRVCPEAGYKLCAWRGRLATDSDQFLWDPYGPLWDYSLWGQDFGPVALAPEAARLVPAIIAAYPVETARAAALNTLRQLMLVRVGDTLVPDFLNDAVLPKLELYFPANEVARFEDARQVQGGTCTLADPFWPLHLMGLAAGCIATLGVLLTQGRDRLLWGFAATVAVALLANAAATGALSGPHDRYQARIAWLIVLPGLVYAARRKTSSGDMRTSAS